MTHANEAITRYINSEIESMEHTIRFTAEKEWKNTTPTKSEYARWSVNGTYNNAYGALIYAYIYAKEITEEQFTELKEKLFAAHSRIERETWKL